MAAGAEIIFMTAESCPRSPGSVLTSCFIFEICTPAADHAFPKELANPWD